MWKLIDDRGIIYSGSEEEMRLKIEEMLEIGDEWFGDLLLVKVIEIHR